MFVQVWCPKGGGGLVLSVNLGQINGIRSRYGITESLAAKPGTSQDYSDAWTLAFTDKLVISA